MKIVTLTENTACREGLTAEHGLSLYIETGSHKILFDAGQTGAFADNAEKLGIDLSKVDFAVLSHGHYDHGGGLKRFQEINKTARIYVSRAAFGLHYNGTEKYIGLDPALRESDRLIFTEDFCEISKGIALYSCNERQPFCHGNACGLNVLEEGVLLPDDFRHEQYLLIGEDGKTVCFSGCSHKGILNIVRWFRPDNLVGGFHFVKLEDEDKLRESARFLLDSPTMYYTGHCTGEKQYRILKSVMGDRLHSISTGTMLEL